MTNIYVRKSGNDSNDGSTPALAKLTIASAISVASTTGDIIWLGAGIYREQNLVTGAKDITIYGDITGENTGDAGEVIWTGANSTDTAIVSGYAIWGDTDGYGLDIQNIIFQNFKFNYDSVVKKTTYGDLTCKNLTFDRVYSTATYGVIQCVHTDTSSTETITLENIYFKNITVNNVNSECIRISTPSTTANSLKICNIKIDGFTGNCYIVGIKITFNGTIIDRIENIEISSIRDYNNTAKGFEMLSDTAKSVYNISVDNIKGLYATTGIELPIGSTAYNCSVSPDITTQYTNATQVNCTNKITHTIPIIDKISKFSAIKGQGYTSYPTTDIKGNPRPAYGNGTACDIGAIESTSDIIQKESTIKDSGDYSVKVAPCNYFKKVFQIPVTASELRTVKVKIRIDGTWGTYLPRVSLSGQGMTLSQATKNSTTGAFEELTVSGTPTTTGIALLTIEAHSVSTDAVFYIDTITVE